MKLGYLLVDFRLPVLSKSTFSVKMLVRPLLACRHGQGNARWTWHRPVSALQGLPHRMHSREQAQLPSDSLTDGCSVDDRHHGRVPWPWEALSGYRIFAVGGVCTPDQDQNARIDALLRLRVLLEAVACVKSALFLKVDWCVARRHLHPVLRIRGVTASLHSTSPGLHAESNE